MDIRSFIVKLNTEGIPLPLVRYEGRGNLSATVFALATVIVVLGLGFNLSAYVCNTFCGCSKLAYFPMGDALTWFGTCSVPYIFRKAGTSDSSSKDS